MWWRGWTHEGAGRRGANTCGGKGGHMRGREEGAIACGGEGACNNNEGQEERTK